MWHDSTDGNHRSRAAQPVRLVDFRYTAAATDVKKLCEAQYEDCGKEKRHKRRDENQHTNYANQELQFGSVK